MAAFSTTLGFPSHVSAASQDNSNPRNSGGSYRKVWRRRKQYVDKNRDKYGFEKKAILHVLSNRMNDSGIYRPDAYIQKDPFKPDLGFIRQQLYDQTE